MSQSEGEDDEISFMYSVPCSSGEQEDLDWDARLNFWQEKLEQFCESLNTCSFSIEETEAEFTYKGIIPKPWRSIVKRMLQRGIVRHINALLPVNHESTYNMDYIYKNMYHLMWKLTISDDEQHLSDHYFYMPKVKEMSSMIYRQFLDEEINGKAATFDLVTTFNALKKRCVRWLGGDGYNICDTSLKAILAYLQEEGGVIIKNTTEEMFLKFLPPGTESGSNSIEPLDIATYQLKAVLEKERSALAEISHCIEEKKSQLLKLKKKGMSPQLQSCFRQYKALCNKDVVTQDRIAALEKQLEVSQATMINSMLMQCGSLVTQAMGSIVQNAGVDDIIMCCEDASIAASQNIALLTQDLESQNNDPCVIYRELQDLETETLLSSFPEIPEKPIPRCISSSHPKEEKYLQCSTPPNRKTEPST